MKKNPTLLIVLGVLLLGIGAFLHLTGGPARADSTLVQNCRQEMTSRGADADMIAKCSDAAFATAVTATDANAAARSISAGNNAEIGSNMLAMFLMGIGLVLAIGGVVARQKARA